MKSIFKLATSVLQTRKVNDMMDCNKQVPFGDQVLTCHMPKDHDQRFHEAIGVVQTISYSNHDKVFMISFEFSWSEFEIKPIVAGTSGKLRVERT